MRAVKEEMDGSKAALNRMGGVAGTMPPVDMKYAFGQMDPQGMITPGSFFASV